MKLAIYSNQEISQLEKWVEEYFTSIENKNLELPDFSVPKLPFDKDNLG
jgi:secreted Zn-dependent insulinase-like peptidase